MIALDENKLKTQRTCFRINVEIALLFILPTALVNSDYFAPKKSIYIYSFFWGGGGGGSLLHIDSATIKL